MQDVDAMVVGKFISKLQKTKAVSFRGRKPKSEFVSACTIEKINKRMRCAFERVICCLLFDPEFFCVILNQIGRINAKKFAIIR